MENNFSPKNYKNYRIIFAEEKYPILHEILKKYGLEDLDEKALDSTSEGDPIPSPSMTILNAVTNIVEGTLQPKDVPGLLKTSLNLSDKDANSLSNDMKTKLVVICKKVSLEEDRGDLAENRIHNKPEETPNEIPVPETSGKRKINANNPPGMSEAEKIKKIPRSGPDNYRESIE